MTQLFSPSRVYLAGKGTTMGLVMAGLFTLVLLLLVFWAWALRASLGRDREQTEARAREQQERRAEAEREARLREAGVPLRCLGCGTAFPGPLPETGCPHCHLSALVVPEEKTIGNER